MIGDEPDGFYAKVLFSINPTIDKDTETHIIFSESKDLNKKNRCYEFGNYKFFKFF